MSAAPAVPTDALDTLPCNLSPLAKNMQASPPSDPDTQPGDEALVRRLASSNLGNKIYPPLTPGMEEEIPDTYVDSQTSNFSKPDILEKPALEPTSATNGTTMPEVNEPQSAKTGEQGCETKTVDIQKAGDTPQDGESDDLFHVIAPVSRAEQFQLRDALQGDRKRKIAETGEDDPEEGEPKTKTEKKAAEKIKKGVAEAKAKAKAKAKAEADSKKALEKAQKKFLADTKAKAKAAQAAEKANSRAKPRPKPASRTKKQKAANTDDDAPVPMDEEPAPEVNAEKKTFAGRLRPSQHGPAARFDAVKKVFITHVKDKVTQKSTMEAPGLCGLLQHTPLPLTTCCTIGRYGLNISNFIHQIIGPVRFYDFVPGQHLLAS